MTELAGLKEDPNDICPGYNLPMRGPRNPLLAKFGPPSLIESDAEAGAEAYAEAELDEHGRAINSTDEELEAEAAFDQYP